MAQDGPKKRISSEGMDRQIPKEFWTPKRIAMMLGGFAILVLFIYSFVFMDVRSTLNVDRDKLTISTVQQDTFQEFIQVRGTVQPIRTMYLAAQSGGVVEKLFRQSGTMVQQGDTILTLSNSDLRLNVMQRTSSIYDQINQARNSRLSIESNTLSLKQQLANAEKQLRLTKAEYERQKQLYQKDLTSKKKYLEAKENYEYQKKHYNLIHESFQQDSLRARMQLQQIDESLDRMWTSLNAVRDILDNLVVTAPIAGQLSMKELHPGQSISPGERIGQVDVLKNYKVRLNIDEYHLPRISRGLEGSFTYDDKQYKLEISKVYPVVEEGQFEVDMEFVEGNPTKLRRGQSVRIRLELGQSSKAKLLSRGGFYSSTGGNWVYKVVDGGDQAVRHPIEIGRQNPEYFEIMEGLKPGDKVITSSYDTFGENQVLELN